MKPKLKYWQTLEQLQKGWEIPAIAPYTCPQQCFDVEAEFDDLHRDAIVQELIKNRYIICGNTHQDYAIPVFDDGYIMLSMRKWKELMEEAYEICYPNHSGMPNFYMNIVCDIQENLPKTSWGKIWTSQ